MPGRVRDALGVPLPPGLPTAFLERGSRGAARRGAPVRPHAWAVHHGGCSARRFALPTAGVEATLQRLVGLGRVIEGGFRPGGCSEWIDAEVLRTVRRKSLASLRKEVEPVAQRTLARLFTRWQGTVQPRRGLDALLDVIENLQGAPLPASLLETEILPARITGYKPADLDTLVAAGEVVWTGLEPLGEHDGRIGLYLAERLPLLWPPDRVRKEAGNRKQEADEDKLSEREEQIVAYLRAHGASFFQQLHDGVGGGYPGETLEALWSLVWRGLLTNDAVHALRAYCERPAAAEAVTPSPHAACMCRRASAHAAPRRPPRRAAGA